MSRLEIALLVLATACALATVAGQHKARRLFAELDKERELTRQMNIEWGQLQLEQSTWAMHSRIERIAAQQLGMARADSRQVRLIENRSHAGPPR